MQYIDMHWQHGYCPAQGDVVQMKMIQQCRDTSYSSSGAQPDSNKFCSSDGSELYLKAIIDYLLGH